MELFFAVALDFVQCISLIAIFLLVLDINQKIRGGKDD
jgi:hypothetical protein